MKNIFDLNVDAIVNPVNCVRVVGKGLAKEFKKRFPFNAKLYHNTSLNIGDIFINRVSFNSSPKWIINLPTKKDWRDPSKLEYVSLGLQELRDNIITWDDVWSEPLKSLAVPALGCGLGQLRWFDVKNLFLDIFGTTNGQYLQTHVQLFPPQDFEPKFLDRLLLTYTDVVTKKLYVIGKLQYIQTKIEDNYYIFEYLEGFNLAQSEIDFQPLPCFPDVDCVYVSYDLFTMFNNRVMSPQRNDYKDYLRLIGLNPNKEWSKMEQLRKSKGRKITDNFMLIDYSEMYYEVPDNWRELYQSCRKIKGNRCVKIR